MPIDRPAVKTKRLAHDVRHEQLLDLAEELFATLGYSVVSIEDIARKAGVTRPVIYTHFGTKEGVYLACVRRARQQYEKQLLGAIDFSAPPLEQLRAGARTFFGMLRDDPGRWRLLFGSYAVLPGMYSNELAELRSGTTEQIRFLLAAAGSNVDPELVEAGANGISGIGESLGHWWLSRPEIPLERMVDYFVTIAWSGVAPHVDDHSDSGA